MKNLQKKNFFNFKVRDEMKMAGALPSEELIFDPSSGKMFPCSTNFDDTDKDREQC